VRQTPCGHRRSPDIWKTALRPLLLAEASDAILLAANRRSLGCMWQCEGIGRSYWSYLIQTNTGDKDSLNSNNAPQANGESVVAILRSEMSVCVRVRLALTISLAGFRVLW
jgi:hypothetical protein